VNATPPSAALAPLVVRHSFSVVRRSCGKLPQKPAGAAIVGGIRQRLCVLRVRNLEVPSTDHQFGFDRLDRAKAAAALLRIETVLSQLGSTAV
jgi:hypothetical protein